MERKVKQGDYIRAKSRDFGLDYNEIAKVNIAEDFEKDETLIEAGGRFF